MSFRKAGNLDASEMVNENPSTAARCRSSVVHSAVREKKTIIGDAALSLLIENKYNITQFYKPCNAEPKCNAKPKCNAEVKLQVVLDRTIQRILCA